MLRESFQRAVQPLRVALLHGTARGSQRQPCRHSLTWRGRNGWRRNLTTLALNVYTIMNIIIIFIIELILKMELATQSQQESFHYVLY